MDELLDVIDVLGVTHIGGLDGWNNVLPQMMDTITTQYYSHQVQTTKSVREVSSSMLLVPLMSCTETDSMDEDFDSSGVTRENIDVSHDYQGRREEKRRRLEAIDQDHNYFIPARDKTSDMGDRRTIPRAVQKRRADRTLVLGVEDSGSEGTLESLDSQDHHISIDESDSGEESSTSSDRWTSTRTVQMGRTHRQTDINTSSSPVDRPTVGGTLDNSWSSCYNSQNSLAEQSRVWLTEVAQMLGPQNGSRGDSSYHNTSFSPTLFSFNEDVGLSDSCNVSQDSSELDYFLEMFTPHLIDRTVMEANNYHDYLMTTQTFPKHSPQHRWTPTNRNEMYMFICVVMSMAHVKKNRMKDYWTKSIPTATPAFAEMMTQDRYFALLRHLYFSDSREHVSGNKLQKVKWLVDYLRNKFTSNLKPCQDLCIDESLLLRRDNLNVELHDGFGLKLFVLLDVKTGYILDFIVYTGTGTDIKVDKELGYSGSIVKNLLAQYLDKGHNLYVDSWYTSPKLFKYLQSRKTGACGIVRSDRALIPVLPSVKHGEQFSFHKDDILCVKWRDQKVVHMLTTLHSNTLVNTDKKDGATGASIKKPVCLVEYSRKMRPFDKANMLVSNVQCVRNSLEWYKKLYFHLLDMCLLNSYFMYIDKTGKKPPLVDFSLSVIRQMIQRFGRASTTAWPVRSSTVSTNLIRLSARHFPSEVPSTPKNPRPRRNCHVCRHTNRRETRRQNTHWMCEDCGVGLCVPQCFKDYHTRINY